MVNTLITLVGLVIAVLGVVLLSLSKLRVSRGERQKVNKGCVIFVALGIIVTVVGNCFTVVPTGYTGVRTTFGLIDQESCRPGFNIVTPFVQTISLVNNKQQDLRFEERIWSETKEQTVVYMEGVSVTYQIDPASSAWIYANVENWVEELVDFDLVSSSAKSASRRLGADTVTDRAEIEPAVRAQLQEALDGKYGVGRVVVKTVVINNIDFEDTYNQAIAEKSNAIQDQQKQEIINQTNIDKAKAEAEAERQRAQGEADAELIRAEGKAQANKKIADSLSDATQRQDAIDKWNGELPRYIGGNGEGTFGIIDVADMPTATDAGGDN